MNLLLMALMQIAPPMKPEMKPTWTNVRATTYQPHQKTNRPWLDSQGGGAVAGWTGQKLQRWHCAVGKSIPLGTRMWIAAPFNREVLAVDTGSAVRGKHIDVCIPDPHEYRKMYGTYRINVYRLGKLTRSEARRWKPAAVSAAKHLK